MNKSDFIPIIAIAGSLISTQTIAFVLSDGNSSTFKYIALWTIGLQWLSFIHANGFFGGDRTEKHYDLVGSITFVTATVVNWIFSNHGSYSMRVWLLNIFIVLWTVRLGTFLHARIKRNNGIDGRFAEFKTTSFQFMMIWTLQGVWVFVMLLPLLITTQSEKNLRFKPIDYFGCILYIIGFLFESIADYQKQKFRSIPENKDKFIKSGLWEFSRHPNYFGEILIWISIALIAYSGSRSYAVFISPVFITSSLLFGSGIPILEKIADERFGNNEQYKRYKRSTPILIPFIYSILNILNAD